MHKNCIISFANERGNYIKALKRLEESLKTNFNGDFLGFIGEESIGAPPHLENPYSFKLFAFNEAIRRGYENILWLDSSVYAIANIDHIFDHIEEEGYIMQEAGAYVGNWCNDKGLEYYKLSRDEAMKMPMYGNAGFLGLNFTSSNLSVRFLNYWWEAFHAGLFIGEWDNNKKTESQDERCKGHRHEMAIGSIIANWLGLNYQRGDEILQYAAPNDEKINSTICFFAQGI